jgi:hypothetical protein
MMLGVNGDNKSGHSPTPAGVITVPQADTEHALQWGRHQPDNARTGLPAALETERPAEVRSYSTGLTCNISTRGNTLQADADDVWRSWRQQERAFP